MMAIKANVQIVEKGGKISVQFWLYYMFAQKNIKIQFATSGVWWTGINVVYICGLSTIEQD